MLLPEPRVRVAFVCGGLPVDSSHLQLAAEGTDLIVHRSSWVPAGVAVCRTPPRGVRVIDHAPAWRSRRGHLAFVYPGLFEALERQRPDVVHVVSEPWGLLAVQAAHWVRRRALTRLVLHGCDTQWHHGSRAERVARRALLRFTLPTTAAWLAESDKALDVARRSGLPVGSLVSRIHTNPRDGGLFRRPESEARLAARARLGVAADEVAVGFLGRLAPEKGLEMFLDAAQSLLAAGRPMRFFVAGDGPMREEVERRSAPGLVFLGRLDHPVGVVQLFSALDVLACPSLTTPDWEDQGPRSVLEAMMCGCIPVATRTGALPEMLAGRGVLTSSLDAEALGSALLLAAELSGDDLERDRLAAWAQATWSSPAVAEKLLRVWRTVAPPATRVAGADA